MCEITFKNDFLLAKKKNENKINDSYVVWIKLKATFTLCNLINFSTQFNIISITTFTFEESNLFSCIRITFSNKIY